MAIADYPFRAWFMAISLHYTRWMIIVACGVAPWVLPFHQTAGANSSVAPVSTAETPSERRITIKMESYEYTPSEMILEIGQMVTLILQNHSFLVPHNFLLDDPQGVRILEADVASGEEQVVQFTPIRPGIYPFYCDKQLLFFPSHREQGMEGRFLVR